MIDAASKDLIRWAVDYIDRDNQHIAMMHKHVRTGEIEPPIVRNAVAATNRWIEKARRFIAQGPLPATVNPPAPPGPPPPAPPPPPSIRRSNNEVVAIVEGVEPDQVSAGTPLQISIVNRAGGQVRLQFTRSIKWAELDPQQAADLASRLMRGAEYAAAEIGLKLRVRS